MADEIASPLLRIRSSSRIDGAEPGGRSCSFYERHTSLRRAFLPGVCRRAGCRITAESEIYDRPAVRVIVFISMLAKSSGWIAGEGEQEGCRCPRSHGGCCFVEMRRETRNTAGSWRRGWRDVRWAKDAGQQNCEGERRVESERARDGVRQ